ncbi:hypothetical protein E2C01_059766 [Portunus trituberculatus]|uniref:Uncharacterized protein n=1 Tax=Portunus trituberculatus TaxID=210409 RepID=A0A5B7H9D2_PORTR|nr:hypothetical protein [Portunus trituberculatus]
MPEVLRRVGLCKILTFSIYEEVFAKLNLV